MKLTSLSQSGFALSLLRHNSDRPSLISMPLVEPGSKIGTIALSFMLLV